MNRLKKILKGDKATKIIFICGMVGIVLIFISTLNINTGGKSTSVNKSTADDYAEKIETQLSEVVCKITGEKSVKVMVSLDSSGEVIYADAKSISTNNVTDQGSDSKYKSQVTDNTEQNYIIVKDSNGDQRALIVSELSPTVRGVVVVTGYADNPAVAERITSAVTTVLNIPSKKVCVVAAN